MAPRAEPGRGPVGRVAFAAAALLALLVIVALASRGGLGEGGGETRPQDTLLDKLFTGFLVLLVLYIPVAIWIYWHQRKQLHAEDMIKRRSTLASLATYALFLVATLILVRFRDRFGLHRPGAGRIGTGTTHGATTGGTTTAPDRYEPRFDWRAALIVLGVAAAGIVAFLGIRRGRGGPDEVDGSLGDQLSLALDDSLDDVLAERDPRRAVIKAYARMEHSLGAAGLPRVPHEAPFEYVGRALLDLDVSEASVRRLTSLFEHARFSTHEIDEPMRAEAVAALTRVRDELRAEVAA